MTINQLVKSSYENSKSKGFWDDYDRLISNPNLSDDDKKIIKDLFISQKLMLIVSEASESLESLRINKYSDIHNIDDILNMDDLSFIKFFQENVKDSFQDEISDVFIRLGDLCGKMNINVDGHIKLKQKYNETREKMHKKNF